MKKSAIKEFLRREIALALPAKDRKNKFYSLEYCHYFVRRTSKKYKLSAIQSEFLQIYVSSEFARKIKPDSISYFFDDSKIGKKFRVSAYGFYDFLIENGFYKLPLRVILSPEFGVICNLKTMEKM